MQLSQLCNHIRCSEDAKVAGSHWIFYVSQHLSVDDVENLRRTLSSQGDTAPNSFLNHLNSLMMHLDDMSVICVPHLTG